VISLQALKPGFAQYALRARAPTVQQIANDLCDFASMRIQSEVAGVEEAHVSAWKTPADGSAMRK
jgi:hypothetical protein